MTNQTSTPFPATRQDLSDLKKTAQDAASDLSSTVSTHASKAKGQVRDLAGHVQEEGAEHVQQLKGSFNELVSAAQDYALERPLTCLGAAFIGGIFFAHLFRRSRS